MYIFFDIDNTLVSHRGISHIPPETLQAVSLLRKAGHTPAIATGRGGFLTFTTAKQFGITDLVCSGGAQVFVGGQEIHRDMFPAEYLASFREIAAKFPSYSAAIDDTYLYASDAFKPYFSYFNAQAGYDCIKPLHELTSAIICYMMLPPAKLTPEHGLFYAPPEGLRLELMNAFTEARCADSSKWTGIEKFIDYVGASLDDVAAFGDGPNDIEMLERAKIGVAVPSYQHPESFWKVKSAADYVCDDIDDGGILKACKDLKLI